MSEQPPRKRPTPAVYRRRRLVVLLVIVVIAVVVWVLIAQPWRSAAAQSAATRPSASMTIPAAPPAPEVTPQAVEGPSATDDAATAEPETPDADADGAGATPEPTPSAPVIATPCIASDVQVTPVTDAQTYAAGQNPQFSISLTNRSGKDCTMNVGTSTQTFTVMSGSDIWWRSTDCQSEPSDMLVLLAAGQTVTSAAPLTWDRTRSSVGSCDATDRQKAPGGGASYHLSVSIGGISSTQSAQVLLY